MKRIASATALIVFSIVVVFAAMELLVRTLFEEPIKPRFVIDPGYGVRDNQANVSTRHYFPNEYDVEITNNAQGMRDTQNYGMTKSPNTYRIALLGDSFVYGHGVNDHEVVSEKLEVLLNSGGKKKYEILNFGVSGFGQAEELITYREKVRAYQPDAVVVFYFNNDIGNDKVSELFALDEKGGVKSTGKSYLPGVKIRERLYAFPITRWLFEHSQAWNLIRNRLSSLVQNYLLKKQGLKSWDESNDDNANRLNAAIFLQLLDDIKKDNAKPLVFIIPDNKLNSNFAVLNVAPNALEFRKVEIIDGRKYFTSADYYKIDWHWNATGHAKAADLLKEKLSHQLRKSHNG